MATFSFNVNINIWHFGTFSVEKSIKVEAILNGITTAIASAAMAIIHSHKRTPPERFTSP